MVSVTPMFGEMSLPLCSFTYISLNSGLLPISCLKSKSYIIEKEREKNLWVFSEKETYFRYALSEKYGYLTLQNSLCCL
jgi:hypothetical protein